MKPGKKMLAVIFLVIAAIIYIAGFGLGNNIKSVFDMRYGIDIRGGVEAIFEPQNLKRQPTEKELDSAREIIESRLDAQNITDREVTVDKNGGYVIVQFPWKSGETNFNPEDAIKELGQMAQLTFRAPDGKVLVEGKYIKNAATKVGNSGATTDYQVALEFNAEGAKLFQKATGELIGKQLSIYMDQNLISSPTVQSQISGGQAVITNLDSMKEAKQLAEKINAGSLPFSLKTTNFQTISPSLGSNALGVMVAAGVIAFFVVCAFMMIYYKLPGVIACITLVMQMLLQLLAISIPQFTLTLPGIAGIILTLGMSVDANIIISERISEELMNGRSILDAVKSGYKHAFTSVLDGNITTAIVAVILMIFGSGSMLSFGYTLLIGMFINLFTGVTVSRHFLLSFIDNKRWNKEKYFRKKKQKKSKPFYQKKIIYAIISGIIFLIGVAAVFGRGVKLDTQFTGGAVLSYTVSNDADMDLIQKAIMKQTARPVTVQVTKDNITGTEKLSITLAGKGGLSPEDQKAITKAINSTSPNVNAKLSQTYAVEPYIGAKALKNAGLAILFSFIAIGLYIAVRFTVLSGFSAGVMAVVSLIHDFAVVFFAFVVFGIPLNDAFVAVVLTIIGYSINDTIVIYDRIRENRKVNSSLSFVEMVNDSLSQTLGRSINTVLMTAICILIILITSSIYQIDSIIEFSLPMLIGVVIGCYSSICIAVTLWAMWIRRKEARN